MSKNISELSGRQGLDNNLFENLGQAAQADGTPSKESMAQMAKEFLIGKANVYGSASFYDFTRESNRGKKAYVCSGSACLTAGTQNQVRSALNNTFGEDHVGDMCCMGRCHEQGAFHMDGVNYSGGDLDRLSELTPEDGIRDFTVSGTGAQILTAEFPGLDTYYQTLRDALTQAPEEILNEIDASQVRGRGGAGFPMGFKLQACRKEDSDLKFIICNADEGDPGAYSDGYLLEQRPHSVLLGMLLAGYAAGANWGVLYIRAEYPESIRIIEDAIATLREQGYCGGDILNSGFDFDFKVIRAQGAYVCGEETALINSIEGQRPEVRVRPPYPAQEGLFNKPTVVNNVETLACLPYIISQGGAAFANIGTAQSKGTKLVCLDGHFNRPGMYEVDMGTSFDQVVHELGGGFKQPVKALHVGGPLGGLIPMDQVDNLSIDFESFKTSGFLLGHASVVSIPESFPLIEYIQHLFEFTAHESCGKCFPCRLGSKRGSELIAKSRSEGYQIDRELFDDLLTTLEQGSLCALGGGLPLPIKNALQYFGDELNPHFQS